MLVQFGFALSGDVVCAVATDDFSHYSWVFFMKAKDEAFTHARDFILRLQSEFPTNTMRLIHNDNGIVPAQG
jgi:hypothetical protein